MNLTTRTRFGLKAILDIAFHHSAGPVQRRQIAQRQGIPTDYMDQILMKLRAAGLIQSLRGRDGGYHLAKEADKISILDVLEAVEETEKLTSSQNAPGGSDENYATKYLSDPAWEAVTMAMRRQLRRSTLQQMLEDAEEMMNENGVDFGEIAGSRAGYFSETSMLA